MFHVIINAFFIKSNLDLYFYKTFFCCNNVKTFMVSMLTSKNVSFSLLVQLCFCTQLLNFFEYSSYPCQWISILSTIYWYMLIKYIRYQKYFYQYNIKKFKTFWSTWIWHLCHQNVDKQYNKMFSMVNKNCVLKHTFSYLSCVGFIST